MTATRKLRAFKSIVIQGLNNRVLAKIAIICVYICFRLRRKTWERLQLLKNGVLSEVLRDILAGDPINPVLHEPHYAAMDRRLAKHLKLYKTVLGSTTKMKF